MIAYISIIALNGNGLNVPTKRHILTEWFFLEPFSHTVYKIPTSDIGTHTDWKWGAGKVIPCKFKSKESGNSNTHVR